MNKQELENKIKEANWAYWVEANPIISDFEYDRYVEELRKIDPENKLINAFVFKGSDKKVVHSQPMLSLDKAYSLEEVLKWARKYARGPEERFIIMPKYDGLSGKFENGKLSSRGDGKVGQDYTDRLPLIKFKVNGEKKDVLLGEMLITDDDWNNVYKGLKTKSGVPFKNQRNAAAGIIGCDEVEFYAKQGAVISFIDYDLHQWKVDFQNLEKDWLGIVEQIQKLSVPMDGIVIKLEDAKYRESLGVTEHAPRGAVAFKFTNQAKWTKLVGIEWSMGKDQLACIGQVEPVDITGITIKNVKLQLTKPVASDVNSYLLDGSLQIGDDVLIERAGDIIPHVRESKAGVSRREVHLQVCPFCGGKLEVSDTAVRCVNPECKMKKVQGLVFSMQTLDFKGVGEKYAEGLVEKLGVDSVSKLLTVTREELIKYPDVFGKKLVDVFLREQEKAKKNSLELILTAMNIPSLGKAVSKLIVSNFKFDDIKCGKLTYEDLIKIRGIGKVVAKEVSVGLKKNVDELMKLEQICKFEVKKTNVESESGETICFTGKMSRGRSELENVAKMNGFTPMDHVDKSTKILVCADPNSNSSKMQKARKLGVSVISEQDFFDMINK